MCGYQTESLQLVVGENHMLASVTDFQVSQARYARKAPDFCHRESQKHCSPVLLN
jgi:hypothetical protein